MYLPADERKAATQLAEGAHDPIHQRLLEAAIRRPVAQVEEDEHIRGFRDLLRQIRIRRCEFLPEVRGGRADSFMGAVHDLV